jgi:hypothetical protein
MNLYTYVLEQSVDFMFGIRTLKTNIILMAMLAFGMMKIGMVEIA